MADVFDLYVKDNRTIQFKFTEPIMLEDSRVTDWVFHIPRMLNNIDVSGWAWWLVYINARGQKYSELLELSEDPESPLEKCIATYSVDYGMSIKAGIVRFSLEAINTDTGGEILNEWHTQTYQTKVQDTLQGNQVEFAETESDIISALIVTVQNKVSQLVGGATPEPKNLVADMTDPKKVYLYVGSEDGESTNYWYYYNGTQWVAGGLYAGGITVDAVPTQGSNNAVSSGGVYDAFGYTKDLLSSSLGTRYIDYEQGTISSEGIIVDNANWVRTSDYIPIDRFIEIYKPIGIQYAFYYYENNSEESFIRSRSGSQSIACNESYLSVRTSYPTAKYFKIRARMYDGSTALQTTPEMIIGSDLNLLLSDSVDNRINDAINNGYIDISNLSLSESYSFDIPYSANKYENMLFTIRCKFTGEQPIIRFSRSWKGIDGNLHTYYGSANYPIGGTNFVKNTFRIPKFFATSGALTVSIDISAGSTVIIDHMYNSYGDNGYICDYGINLNGHGKYGCGAPQNTLAGYIMAHEMGYKYCITIPKVTSDGVLVCLHDDDSIQATARNDDGSQIASEYRDRAVSTFTYQELLQFDFGISRGLPFKGERIPKLEDFFALCAKTGMHPMLSCHPSLSGYWTDIKALAIKYNLLDKLNVKCDYSNITVMMDVLGGNIESYTIDESGAVDRAERMTTLISRYNIDTTKCRCGVEYITNITDELIQSALSAGLFVGFANYQKDATTVKTLITKGVTEFTDDYIASVGLNW